MPKQLINLLGVVACAVVLVLAIALGALPIYFASLATGTQTALAAQNNDLLESQVDGLLLEQERLDEISASVSSLREQVPTSNRLDGVFELIARAAATTNVQVQTVAAEDNAPFITRTSPVRVGEEPEPSPTETMTDVPTGEAATPEAEGTTEAADVDATPTPITDGAPLEGRQQVAFTIDVTASQLQDAITFLDRLRDGPRLLSTIETSIIPTGTRFDVSVAALAFVLPEE